MRFRKKFLVHLRDIVKGLSGGIYPQVYGTKWTPQRGRLKDQCLVFT
jgi:hypothetical protein